jgi:hypothetical protein
MMKSRLLHSRLFVFCKRSAVRKPSISDALEEKARHIFKSSGIPGEEIFWK